MNLFCKNNEKIFSRSPFLKLLSFISYLLSKICIFAVCKSFKKWHRNRQFLRARATSFRMS